MRSTEDPAIEVPEKARSGGVSGAFSGTSVGGRGDEAPGLSRARVASGQ